MATPQVIQNNESEADAVWFNVGTLQAASASNANYEQLPPTGNPVPSEGAETSVDKTTVIASKNWGDVPTMPNTAKFVYICDEYVSPNGKGYFMRAQMSVAGAVWEKTYSFGPDDLSHDWRLK